MVKITGFTAFIEGENINTLREIGFIRITPKLSCSAEEAYFGKLKKKIDARKCEDYTDCLDCPQYCACNNIDTDYGFNSKGNGRGGW